MQVVFLFREHSSVGLERLLDKQEVCGSNPHVPTNENQTVAEMQLSFFLCVLFSCISAFFSCRVKPEVKPGNYLATTVRILCCKSKMLANGADPLMTRWSMRWLWMAKPSWKMEIGEAGRGDLFSSGCPGKIAIPGFMRQKRWQRRCTERAPVPYAIRDA